MTAVRADAALINHIEIPRHEGRRRVLVSGGLKLVEFCAQVHVKLRQFEFAIDLQLGREFFGA